MKSDGEKGGKREKAERMWARRGERESKGRENASGFFFGLKRQRTRSRSAAPRVRDRSNFFLHASIHERSHAHRLMLAIAFTFASFRLLNQEHLGLAAIRFANQIRHAPRALHFYVASSLRD